MSIESIATAQQKSHNQEIKERERFEFGNNWARFLSVLNEQRICEAEDSLKVMLQINTLSGKTFLDVGSGSGLFSLAARRLGAKVVSFDFDPQSVACTAELKRRFHEHDMDWLIEEGSALDTEYLDKLGKFDIVYSWGVLHHTGAMWQALGNIDRNVGGGGKLFIALYNYQPFASKYWLCIKRLYNKKRILRPFIAAVHILWPMLPSLVLRRISRRKYPRGMSPWYDLTDWLGGYPFEVCKPEEIFVFYKTRGYALCAMKTVGGKLGCNEFVFERTRR